MIQDFPPITCTVKLKNGKRVISFAPVEDKYVDLVCQLCDRTIRESEWCVKENVVFICRGCEHKSRSRIGGFGMQYPLYTASSYEEAVALDRLGLVIRMLEKEAKKCSS